jgi:hypothetical protein
VFPENTPGFVLDVFARSSLWKIGLDYRHGIVLLDYLASLFKTFLFEFVPYKGTTESCES